MKSWKEAGQERFWTNMINETALACDLGLDSGSFKSWFKPAMGRC